MAAEVTSKQPNNQTSAARHPDNQTGAARHADMHQRDDDGYNPVPIPHEHAFETLPRVSTARVPLLNTVPSEIRLRRPKSLAKPHEHSKQLSVQKFAHGHILDIGSEIHRMIIHAADEKTEAAVVEAENRVWQHSEAIRVKALQDLQTNLDSHYGALIMRTHKEHEKALKEEALRVETAMRQLSLEQVKQEREDGDKRLKDAVRQTEMKFDKTLKNAVDVARSDERTRASVRHAELERSWQSKYDAMVSQTTAQRKRELEKLTDEKDWERQRAVLQAKQSERETASNQQKRITETFESRIQLLNDRVDTTTRESSKSREEKNVLECRLHDVGEELFLTRDAFQDYIQQVYNCLPGQADYQMPVTRFKREDFL